MRSFGLIGKDLSHSFSETYFNRKFKELNISDAKYKPYPMPDVNHLRELVDREKLVGFNVTIPFKVSIVDHLDELDHIAQQVGAVNTVLVNQGKLKGYNTDVYGFKVSFQELLQEDDKNALVLGSGGASRAVCFVLHELGLNYLRASRFPEGGEIEYKSITPDLLREYTVLINTTPLGMYPNEDKAPDLLYEHLSNKNYLFDLIYNPVRSRFLEFGEAKGARTKNGAVMLELQADKAWDIWNGIIDITSS
ncbi:MAG: shikimate dehydrogenase [Bacteroidetes bacterium]|nr:shikimate dehydrogenase [Bacteroidota bacterium]